MSTSLLRVVERAQQDAEQGPEAIQSNGLRRVSAPPTPTGRGPARSAHETLGRTLQLLRSERQPSKSGPSGSRHATGLAKMAAPSQPAHASHVGAVQPIVGTLPASPAAGCRADMGGVATRHISGGAGWWKSPCPVLVRASGEQSPGATRPLGHFRSPQRPVSTPCALPESSRPSHSCRTGSADRFGPSWYASSKSPALRPVFPAPPSTSVPSEFHPSHQSRHRQSDARRGTTEVAYTRRRSDTHVRER